MEVYMHSGEKAADEVYAVSGGVIDGVRALPMGDAGSRCTTT